MQVAFSDSASEAHKFQDVTVQFTLQAFAFGYCTSGTTCEPAPGDEVVIQ